ncbi:MAG: SRPBCC family protein [Chitinophagales bacterium]|nr:SRPBCC family protein [Chitinophagales bacterium]
MLYQIHTKQFLPISVKEAWDFLSSPANLQAITPDYMGFQIRSGFREGEKMYAGMIIEYTVRPVLGIPLHWVTEITHVQEPEYFVDEQRFGPYALWHHKHFIRPVEGGVEMEDVVHYKLPLGWLGKLAHMLFVKRQLRQIFDFREKKLTELFGQSLRV